MPILVYFDIFKNYYANTQEEDFYMIGASPKLSVTINSVPIPNPDNIPAQIGRIWNGKTITITPETITENEILIRVKTSGNAKEQVMAPSALGSFSVKAGKVEIAITDKIPTGEIWYIRSIQTINRITLENYPLENLDTIRDKILLTAGDAVFDISTTTIVTGKQIGRAHV